MEIRLLGHHLFITDAAILKDCIILLEEEYKEMRNIPHVMQEDVTVFVSFPNPQGNIK